GTATLSWGAAFDNTGVAHYNVYRSTTSGFTPSSANRVAQPTTTSYTDTGLGAGTYYYLVTAEDATGNVGPASAEASAAVQADTLPPSAALASPANTATVPGTITVPADASDLQGLAGVQFLLDGSNLGAELTADPFTVTWNTLTAVNGTHVLSARARDTGGNT